MAPANHPLFIIWNVGQGQWLTGVQWDRCDHFDFGGEKFPLRQLQRICSKKENSLQLSHWDFDHWNGLPKFQRITSQFCHSPWPIPAPPKTLPRLATKIPSCSQIMKPWYHAMSASSRAARTLPSNDSSQVYVFKDQILIPGDSTQKMEQFWAGPDLGIAKKNIRILVLGHHGSKTSSSETLLNHLPQLKLAVASARKSRYGHPHAVVISRLKKHRIPLLRTEDWGHIGIEL